MRASPLATLALIAIASPPAAAAPEWSISVPTTFPFNAEENGTGVKHFSAAALADGVIVQYDTTVPPKTSPQIALALDAYERVRLANLNFTPVSSTGVWVQDAIYGHLWGDPSGWGILNPTIRIVVETCITTTSCRTPSGTGAPPAGTRLDSSAAIYLWDALTSSWRFPNRLTTGSAPRYGVLVLSSQTFASKTPSPEVIAHEIGHALGFEEQRLRKTAANSRLENPTAVPNVETSTSPAVRGNVFRLGAYAQGFLRNYYPRSGVVPVDDWLVHDEVLRRDPTQPIDAPNRVVALGIFQTPEIAPENLIWNPGTSQYVECQTGKVPEFYAQVSEVSELSAGCRSTVALEYVVGSGTKVVLAKETIQNACDSAFHEYQFRTTVPFTTAALAAAGYAAPTTSGSPLAVAFTIRVDHAYAQAEWTAVDNEVRFPSLTLFPSNTTDARCVANRRAALTPAVGARIGSQVVATKVGAFATQFVVVGSPDRDVAGVPAVGAIQVLSLATGTSVATTAQEAVSPVVAANLAFGDALAISASGATVVVGAPGRANSDGAVWICTNAPSLSCPAVPLSPQTAGMHGRFGDAVAITPDGKSLMIAEPDYPGGGRVNLYYLDADTGTYRFSRALTEPGAARFGAVLAANETWLVVGDPTRNGGGFAKAYRLVPTATSLATGTAIDLGAQVGVNVGQELGDALSVHDNVLAVGAPGTGPDNGKVYVFGQPQGTFVADFGIYLLGPSFSDDWRLVATLSGPNAGSRFGEAVDNHRGDLVVGAPHDSSRGPQAGAAYIYRSRRNEGWQVEVSMFGARSYDRLGRAVALGGMFYVVGEPWSAYDANDTYVGANIGRYRTGPYRTLRWYW